MTQYARNPSAERAITDLQRQVDKLWKRLPPTSKRSSQGVGETVSDETTDDTTTVTASVDLSAGRWYIAGWSRIPEAPSDCEWLNLFLSTDPSVVDHAYRVTPRSPAAEGYAEATAGVVEVTAPETWVCSSICLDAAGAQITGTADELRTVWIQATKLADL